MPRKSKDHDEIMRSIGRVRDDLRGEIDELRTRLMRIESLFQDIHSENLTDGQRLKTIRKLMKLNVQQFAAHVGYSAAAISYMERGQRSPDKLLRQLQEKGNDVAVPFALKRA